MINKCNELNDKICTGCRITQPEYLMLYLLVVFTKRKNYST